jgi:hypothetical protein
MSLRTRLSLLSLAALMLAVASSLAGCASGGNANMNTAVTNTAQTPAASPSPVVQNLTATGRPQKISDLMAGRGEQDQAKPVLQFVSPRDGASVTGSTVAVKLNLTGDLKGYKPMKDPTTGMGNHIHVILDNQPYEAYYDLSQPFELRNVTEGKHTLRAFPSRPWHESYKNDGAFQMVTFTVKGGGDASKPTTTSGGQVMSDNKNMAANKNANMANANAHANGNANANATTNANANANAAPREGKDMAASSAGEVDAKKPLLTYSRPKGEYKGDDANAIMIDFWLKNARLVGDGGEYRVRYSVDGGEEKILEKWEPIWLTGWTGGKHTVEMELIDKDGNKVDNGGYNSTSRDITVVK